MIELQVRGMTCAHCVRAVTEALRGLDPAAHVEVDLEHGVVRAETGASREEAAKAIAEEGYEVLPR